MYSVLKAVVIDVWLCCSAASDYRKRRKSEPSSSQVTAQSQSRAATSPKPVDAYRPSSSLKKPVIRSSPSSPSRAKGTHTYRQTSLSLRLLVFLFPLVFPRLSYVCTILTTSPENQRRFIVICCVFHNTWPVGCGHKFPWLVWVEVWRKNIKPSSFPPSFLY